MKRDDALKVLRQNEAALRQLGIKHASLFGSVARDEAVETSDVDIFVTPSTRPFSLVNLIRVRRFMGEALGCPVDVFTHSGLKNALPTVQARIKAEMVDAF